jgi:hypothetical protein
MPRITAVPNYDAMLNSEVRAYAEWQRRGDAATSADICKKCLGRIWPDDYDNWPDAVPLEGEPVIEHGYTAEVGAEHPPYVDADYVCAICGEQLTSEDD